jgi:RND superfamily putative drug exporter
VTLIGLGVAIDYSLFIVTRFRDELASGLSSENALANTMSTAGRAITFSGLTVAIGLSAMLFYQGTFMASMGIAGAIVVGLAVLYALTLLPALLAVIGPGVNRLRLPSRHSAGTGKGFWHGLATWVMRRPVLVLLPTVAFLVVAASPFLQMRIANGSVDMLPTRLEARQGYDRLVADFPGQNQTTFQVVVDYPDGSPLTAQRIGDQYDLDRRIAGIPGVLGTNSIYTLDTSLGRAEYQAMYPGDSSLLTAPVRQALATTVGKHIVIIQATSSYEPTSDRAREIVKAIRGQGVGNGGRLLVGGETASDLDTVRFITDRTPIAVTFVVLVSCLILFLLTGSVVLPLKAVLLNLLSIGASFGALVWIFQQGHLSQLLGFTPQSLDPSIPVILFSIVFGMSMDYEVLLVSRIQEEYQRTRDNARAVADGLERSGRLITGAALIMVAVFLAFGLAEVVIIKAIGIGLAIAVAIDATLVRALVVPALMRLMGDLNWWAPKPLRWLYRRAAVGESARNMPRSEVAAARLATDRVA